MRKVPRVASYGGPGGANHWTRVRASKEAERRTSAGQDEAFCEQLANDAGRDWRLERRAWRIPCCAQRRGPGAGWRD